MNIVEKRHIDRCVVEICEGGTSRDALDVLATMLQGSDELQDYYAHALNCQLLIQDECSFLHLNFKPLAPMRSPSPKDSIPCARPADSTVASSRAFKASSARLGAISQRLAEAMNWKTVSAVAATLLLALLISQGVRHGEKEEATADLPKAIPHSQEPPVMHGEIIVSHGPTLNMVSSSTQTEAITSIRLTNCPVSGGRLKEDSSNAGFAWLERKQKNLERGYVVALQPGEQMEVWVDSCAMSQNTLSVVELDSEGKLDGEWMSFNNLYSINSQLDARLSGLVGRFAKSNASEQTRYFLFAGSHAYANESKDAPWRQSDCRVRFDSNFLLVVGWDDSGYSPAERTSTGEANVDNDYNDMVATIRFSRLDEPDNAQAASLNSVEYFPNPTENPEPLVDDYPGFRMEVRPGQMVVLEISCSAQLQNKICIMELPSRHVVWLDEGKPNGAGKARSGDRGVYVIRNHTDQTRRYEIEVYHRESANTGDNSWRPNVARVNAGAKDFAYVGFEDNIEDATRRNWEDVEVIAHWIDP